MIYVEEDESLSCRKLLRVIYIVKITYTSHLLVLVYILLKHTYIPLLPTHLYNHLSMR